MTDHTAGPRDANAFAGPWGPRHNLAAAYALKQILADDHDKARAMLSRLDRAVLEVICDAAFDLSVMAQAVADEGLLTDATPANTEGDENHG